MRKFCRNCNRPGEACFCALTRPFACSSRIALIVYPREASSTVGTAWILRRSIKDLTWIRSNGEDLDEAPAFRELLERAETVPLLLFPAATALILDRAPDEDWRELVPPGRTPLFLVIDGTWTEARSIVRKSTLLRSLPAVSFEAGRMSEYEFKKQPNSACLSSVESVHHLLEVIAGRGWGKLPAAREHDQMIEIFRRMVRFQVTRERSPRTLVHTRSLRGPRPPRKP